MTQQHHRRNRTVRLTIRLRLTLLYSVLFLAGSVAVLSLNYALVARQISPRQPPPEVIRELPEQPDGAVIPGAKGVPGDIDRINRAFRNATLDSMVRQSAVTLVVTAVLAAVAGWVLAGRALRPVQRITATARELSAHDLTRRIRLKGPSDELKDLADTFDDMLDRLDRSFQSQRRFAANAAHELRTPLTLIRAAADVTLSAPNISKDELVEMAWTVRGAAVQSEQLLASLLALAHSERGVDRHEPVDLRKIAERVVERAQGRAIAARLRVLTDLIPANTTGNPLLLERLVYNLLDNALRYNCPQGWVTISTGSRSDGNAYLSVGNSGHRVHGDVDGLFEPFRRDRLDRTHDDEQGAGLGLSIVKATVEAHGGRLHAEANDQGGLSVLVVLPGHMPDS